MQRENSRVLREGEKCAARDARLQRENSRVLREGEKCAARGARMQRENSRVQREARHCNAKTRECNAKHEIAMRKLEITMRKFEIATRKREVKRPNEIRTNAHHQNLNYGSLRHILRVKWRSPTSMNIQVHMPRRVHVCVVVFLRVSITKIMLM